MEFMVNVFSETASVASSNKLLLTLGSLASVFYYYKNRANSLAKLKYFHDTLENSNSTLKGFLPLIEKKLETQSTGTVLPLLRSPEKAPSMEAKRDLWLRLRNLAFIKATTSVYCVCFEVLVVRIVLLILGKYMYANSVENVDIYTMSQELQTEFLSLSRYLFSSDGFQNLFDLIEESVTQTMTNYPFELNQKCDAIQIQKIFAKIAFETKTKIFTKNVANFLIPTLSEDEIKSKFRDNEEVDFDDEIVKDYQFLFQTGFSGLGSNGVLSDRTKYKLLVNEVLNIIESPKFNGILILLVDLSFDILLANLENIISTGDADKSNSVYMVKLIPQISNQAMYQAMSLLAIHLASTKDFQILSESIFDL